MLSENIMWVVFLLLISTISTIIFCYISLEIEKPVKELKRNIISAVITILLVQILGIIDRNKYTIWLLLLLQIIVMSEYVRYNCEISFKRAFCLAFLYSIFELFLQITVQCFYIGFIELSEMTKNTTYNLQTGVVSLSIMIFVASLIKLKNRVERLEIDMDSYQVLFIPFMVTIINIIVISTFVMKMDNYGYFEFTAIFVLCMALSVSNIYTVDKLIKIISKGIKSDYDNKIIIEKMDSQYKYYNSLKESNERAKKIYHDINNHLMCIKNLENSEQEEYIDELYKSIEENSKSPQTGNMILDVIISEKRSACRKKGINFKCDIDFSRGEFVDMMDVCSIFSNILDNAIEACDKTEENRYINIKGKNVGNYIVLKCINSKSNDIKIDSNGKIETDKSDRDNHGLGMESIRKSVEKYDGNMEIYYDEKEFKVVVYIPIDS